MLSFTKMSLSLLHSAGNVFSIDMFSVPMVCIYVFLVFLRNSLPLLLPVPFFSGFHMVHYSLELSSPLFSPLRGLFSFRNRHGHSSILDVWILHDFGRCFKYVVSWDSAEIVICFNFGTVRKHLFNGMDQPNVLSHELIQLLQEILPCINQCIVKIWKGLRLAVGM